MMVSVIVAVYNGAELLEDCLNSILKQTYKNIELIIIDDGSTDETPAVCQKVMASDPRVRVIRQINGGVSKARNAGIAVAVGTYITFVDADDLLPDNAVEEMVGRMTGDVDLVVGSHVEFRGKTSVLHIKSPCVMTQQDFLENSLVGEKNLRAAWGKLFRLEIIREQQVRFIEKLPMLEDTLFTWTYFRYARSMVVTDAVIYRYRLGGLASTVKYYPDRNAFLRQAMDVYFRYFGGEDQTPRDFLQAKITDGMMDCFRHYVSHCGKKEAVKKVAQTLAMFASYEGAIDPARCGEEMARAITHGDAKTIVGMLQKQLWVRILIKRTKRLVFRVLGSRI